MKVLTDFIDKTQMNQWTLKRDQVLQNNISSVLKKIAAREGIQKNSGLNLIHFWIKIQTTVNVAVPKCDESVIDSKLSSSFV
jgi:hypothetical protein